MLTLKLVFQKRMNKSEKRLRNFENKANEFDLIGCTSNIPNDIGDGYCDDRNNNEGCHFDQGDCCGNDLNTNYCIECICFEDLTCSAPLDLIGNMFCNDETNNAGCEFDGGDCCGACINKEHCIECRCHDESAPILDVSCKQLCFLQM